MSENIHEFVREHHVGYEVSAYYLLVQESNGTAPPTGRRIQAGFDVDLYGATNANGVTAVPSPGCGPALAGLRQVGNTVADHYTGSCSIDVIPFPATVFLDTRNHLQQEAMLRVRISHDRGLDQPASQPEQQALEGIEKELRTLGIRRK